MFWRPPESRALKSCLISSEGRGTEVITFVTRTVLVLRTFQSRWLVHQRPAIYKPPLTQIQRCDELQQTSSTHWRSILLLMNISLWATTKSNFRALCFGRFWWKFRISPSGVNPLGYLFCGIFSWKELKLHFQFWSYRWEQYVDRLVRCFQACGSVISAHFKLKGILHPKMISLSCHPRFVSLFLQKKTINEDLF